MASLKRRGSIYYAQYYVGGKQRRISLQTGSLQLAKEKLRQLESANARGEDNPLPTRTPIAEIASAYVKHIRRHKTPKSAQTDIYYLREMFGPVCEELEITSRQINWTCKKRPRQCLDYRRRENRIEASCIEAITTSQIADFINRQVAEKDLKPKTANRYREIICRLFNWALAEKRIRVPNGVNPASKVPRYAEPAPEITFLTLQDITAQLDALKDDRQLQAMVATFIYAGLRREEALWLQMEDLDFSAAKHGLIRVRAKTVNERSWQPKTKMNRAVPVSSTLAGYLKQHTHPTSDGSWIFPSPKGKRWDPDTFSTRLREANARAGLSWSCLDFRHTFGSQLAMSGVSDFKIAKLMGNSPEIVRRHYAALVPSAMSDDVEF